MLFTYCFVVKELATPLKTIIEVMVEYFIDKRKKSHEVVASSNAIQEAETSLVTTRLQLTVYQLYILYWLGEG